MIYFLKKLEIWVYSQADSISTCTEGQKKNLESKGVPKSKLSCIPDWIDDTYFKINYKNYKAEVSKLYNYPNKTIISFFGNIGALQNPIIFCPESFCMGR